MWSAHSAANLAAASAFFVCGSPATPPKAAVANSCHCSSFVCGPTFAATIAPPVELQIRVMAGVTEARSALSCELATWLRDSQIRHSPTCAEWQEESERRAGCTDLLPGDSTLLDEIEDGRKPGGLYRRGREDAAILCDRFGHDDAACAISSLSRCVEPHR